MRTALKLGVFLFTLWMGSGLATSITIQTSPSGLQFSVDGGPSQTAPQTLDRSQGSHTIAVASPQAGGSGTQYVFTSWSDGGAASHSITVGTSPATYTASFNTQYQLTTMASPPAGGTLTPPSGGYYDSGSVVFITNTPNSGYTFTSWSGNIGSPTSTSCTVPMTGPQTVTANFTQTATPITILTSPEGLLFSVDNGTQQMAPQTLSLSQGPHTIAVATTQPGGTGTQYVFTGWSDGGAVSHTITVGTTPATYTASFKTQYQLTTSASPGAGGTVTPVSGLFYDSGTVVPITATPSSGYSFTNWSGNVASPSSASTTVTMSAPQTVMANFVSTSGITVATSPPGLQIVVDAGPPVMAPQTYNWAAGSSHTIGVNSPQAGAAGTRYAYTSWSDGGGQTHSITVPNSPTTYTASFATQYLLTTSASPGAGGTVTPVSGLFYDSGTVVPITAAPSSGYSFTNWSGNVASPSSASTTVTMSAPQTVMANFVSTSGITVATSPPGLQIVVDAGAPVMAPQTYNWAAGSSHTIGVNSPQAGAAGTRYVYASWSDGGGQTHTVTAPNSPTTYTASFATQYLLTTSASPGAGGTVTPVSGLFYGSGTVVPISATANSGYSFTNWSGNVAAPTSASTTVTMSAPQTVTANFVSTSGITVTTSPPGLQIVVDAGAPVMAPQTYNWAAGSSHTIGVNSPQAGAAGTRYAYASWSDGGAQTHSITVPNSQATYTASFATQYQLTTSASPGVGGTVTPVSGLFYDSGTVVPITAAPSSGYSFTNWSGNVASPSSASTTVTMSAPQTVMANFVSTSGITVATSPPGLQIVVDAGPPVMAPQTYNWAAGSSHTIGVNSPQAGAAGTRYAYTSWSDGGGQTHSITVPNSPTTYTASFTTQYLLTTSASPGAGGTVTPVSGSFYGSGTVVPISATANSGYSFTNWSGNVAAPTSASTTVTMSAPQTVTANFSSTSGITIAASPPGLQIVVDAGTPVMAPQTYNWAAGSSHTIGVNSPQAGAAGTRYAYASWSDRGAQTHSITVPNSQATYTASFATQYQLTTSASPGVGGTVTPVSGLFYDSGTVVPITAAPSSGYSFTNWSGNVASPSSASTTVTMSAPQTVMANFVSTSGITVATSPPGLQIVVDAGPPVMAPQTYNWAAGSSHTIGVNSPQAGAAGTRYAYTSWSDGGGQTHSITVPNSPTTYTASFTTQYLLTTSASPGAGGTVTPVSGSFYGSGTVVPISATANSGYSFTNWSGNVAAPTSASTTVTMSAPQTVTANFSSTSGITIAASPPGLQIVVDAGTPVMAPQTYNWAAGSSHTIGVNSPQAGAAGTRYAYASWSDGGAQTHSITVPNSQATYTASFATQYQLTTSASPGVGGTVTPVSGLFYDSGTVVPITAAPSSGYSFTNWSGNVASPSSASTTVAMSAPQTVIANFVSTSGITVATSAPGLQIVVDAGVPVMALQTYNWAAGSCHTIGVNSPQAGAAGTRYVYASWSDGGGQTHTVTAPNSPTTYTASFATQYLLTTSASPGAGGTVTPVSGLFYGSGTVVPISATANSGYSFTNWSGNVAAPTSASTTVTMSAPQTVTANFVSTSGITVTTSPPGLQIVVDAGAPVMAPQTYNWAAGSSHSIGVNSPQPGASGTRYVYASWSDGGGQTHTVIAPNSPTTYTASFNTQYLLTTAVSPAGAGTVTPNPTSPDGYYNSGTSVGLTAAPSSQFLNWSGDLSGSANPQSIVMNAPHSVNANFGSGVTVIILPFSPSLNAGQCVQIPVSVTGTTNMVVNWSINPNVGTISTTGQYCAPASVNSSQTVTVTATSAADPTKSDKTTITLIPVSVSVSPLKVTLTAGLTQQFSAAIAGSSNTAVNWSINPSVGTISTTGLYTAPSSISTPQLVTVTATSAADPTKSSSATVALSATVAVSVGPANVTLTAKQTQQFSASVTGSGNMAVTWSVNPSVGTISTSGLYTAPSVVSAQQSVTVTAISQADPTKSASTALTLVGPPSIVPPTLPTGVVR